MKVGDLVKERIMKSGGKIMIGIVTRVSPSPFARRKRVTVEYVDGTSMSRLEAYLEVINESR